MKISVVMATYNGAPFIAAQLESLLAQTSLPFELIISDDGSDDGGLDIARRVLENAPFPVSIIENPERLGYAGNFLSAADRARGDYIAFCDQDDVWLPHKLATYARWIGEMPETALFIHRGQVVDVDLKPQDAFHPNVGATVLQKPRTGRLTARPPGFAMCFKRELISSFDWRRRPPDLEFADSTTKHDTWIATLGDTTGGVYYSTDILVLYRRHGKNYSHFRKGSNLTRRLGQWRDALKAPSSTSLATLLGGLRGHAAYFQAAAVEQSSLRSELESQAARYLAAATAIQDRLELLGAGRGGSIGIFYRNVVQGRYRSGGRLDRRALAQDAATMVRNVLGVGALASR